MLKIELTKQKHKPGNVVQRFGDWRKGEPTVIIDNQRWVNYGKPEKVTVMIETEKELIFDEDRRPMEFLPCSSCGRRGCMGTSCGYGAP